MFIDEPTGEGSTGGEPTPSTKQTPAQEPPKKSGTSEPGPVPYERFKEINDKYKELEGELNDIRKKQADADKKKLADEKEFEKLANQYKEERDQERRSNLRIRIGSGYGLDVDMSSRLVGEIEAELIEDAKKLAAKMKTTPAGTPKPPTGGTPPAGPTQDQLQDADWVRKNMTKVFDAGKRQS